MKIADIKNRNSQKINEFIPWNDGLNNKSNILIAEEKKEPIGAIKSSLYREIPWIDIKIEKNGETTKNLIKESLRVLDTDKVYCLISNKEKEKRFLDEYGEIIAEFKCLRDFSFPYKENLKKITDIDSVFDSEAYNKTNGLYPTKDGKIKKIDSEKNIFAIQEKGNPKSIVILDGIKKTQKNRRALFFGFTWCNHKHASQTALATRAKAYEEGLDDVIICLPNNLYIDSFEQAGFNTYKTICIYKVTASSINKEYTQ